VKQQNQDTPHSAPRGFRPVYLIGLLALVIVLALAAAHLFRRSPSTAKNSSAGETVSSGSAADQSASTTANGGSVPDSLRYLIKLLRDPSAPWEQRKEAIRALAKDGSREAMLALDQAMNNSSTQIRLSIADALGDCPSPEALTLLLKLVNDPDVNVLRAAVGSLARQQQAGAAAALARLVTDPNGSADVRCEAALALGSIREPWVLDPLSRAARDSTDPDVAESALAALGKLDFSTTEGFFRDYVQSPDIPSDLRVSAIESLGQSEGDPTAFLTDLASKSSDPDIRLAAASALSDTEMPGNAGPDILAMLKNESDADVRLRLYDALLNQQNVDVNSVLARVQQESDPSARIAGYNALAKLLRDNPTPEVQAYFDQVAVPDLKQMALNGTSSDDQQMAIIALARDPKDPNAMNALNEVGRVLDKRQGTANGNQKPAATGH
jgi:HEAT repeat protein